MGKLFGTDGLRGAAGAFPLDNATVELLGRILYFVLKDRDLPAEVIIGRDTRESGPVLLAALSRGFGGAGGKVHDVGIFSTPALAHLAMIEAKCAISITASHNAFQDNGIKIFGPDGYKISDKTEMEIEPYLLGEKSFSRTSDYSGPPQVEEEHSSYMLKYCDYLTASFPDLDLHGVKVVVDCANGAMCEIAPPVLRMLGAEVTAINAEPNGRNINENAGSLSPEVLFEYIKSTNGFDCGFTFDGDGDRCLAVDSSGIYDGDFILATAGRYLQMRGELKKNEVVGTSMSNIGLEQFFRQHGIVLHRVPVGDKNVLEKLAQDDLSLGGEQSGHIIFMNESFIGDGLMTALQMLRIYRNSGVSFSHLCDGFVRQPQVLHNVRVKSKPELKSIPEIDSKIQEIENHLNGQGRIIVRYSGTENLLRIMIEGPDQTQIERMAHNLGELVRQKLNQ